MGETVEGFSPAGLSFDRWMIVLRINLYDRVAYLVPLRFLFTFYSAPFASPVAASAEGARAQRRLAGDS